MADVYISYSPGDTAAAYRIRNDLESKGISCSITSSAIAARVFSPNEIPVEIRQATFFVILVSRHSISASIAKQELYWATEANSIILPIRLDNAPLNDVFNFYLGTKQWIAARWRLSAASKELCDVICSVLYPATSQPKNDTEDNEIDIHKDDKKLFVRIILCVLTLLTYLVVNTVLYSQMRDQAYELYWDVDGILSLVMIVILFLIMAPIFGGYKAALRTILEKVRDAFRGQ